MKPIVYGNVARYFGKKREEDGHTHSWTSYLRPYKNEVYSLIEKQTLVPIQSHVSFLILAGLTPTVNTNLVFGKG